MLSNPYKGHWDRILLTLNFIFYYSLICFYNWFYNSMFYVKLIFLQLQTKHWVIFICINKYISILKNLKFFLGEGWIQYINYIKQIIIMVNMFLNFYNDKLSVISMELISFSLVCHCRYLLYNILIIYYKSN